MQATLHLHHPLLHGSLDPYGTFLAHCGYAPPTCTIRQRRVITHNCTDQWNGAAHLEDIYSDHSDKDHWLNSLGSDQKSGPAQVLGGISDFLSLWEMFPPAEKS
ncbi:hypothetical protein XENTR_v10003292 [Xenopus tropicalis]|nr:hypothetical protein XENTR_v10003292 [Xenopus tropicalis]